MVSRVSGWGYGVEDAASIEAQRVNLTTPESSEKRAALEKFTCIDEWKMGCQETQIHCGN